MSERTDGWLEGYRQCLLDIYDTVTSDKHQLTEDRLMMLLTNLRDDTLGEILMTEETKDDDNFE